MWTKSADNLVVRHESVSAAAAHAQCSRGTVNARLGTEAARKKNRVSASYGACASAPRIHPLLYLLRGLFVCAQDVYTTTALGWLFWFDGDDPPLSVPGPGTTVAGLPWRYRFEEAQRVAFRYDVKFTAADDAAWAVEVKDLHSTPSGKCTRCNSGEVTNSTTLKSIIGTGAWACSCRSHGRYKHRIQEVKAAALASDLEITEDDVALASGLGKRGRLYMPPLRCTRLRCDSDPIRKLTAEQLLTRSEYRRQPCPCRLAAGPGGRAHGIYLKVKDLFREDYIVEREYPTPIPPDSGVTSYAKLPYDVVIFDRLSGRAVLAFEPDGVQHTEASSFSAGASEEEIQHRFFWQKKRDRAKDSYWRRMGVSTLRLHQMDYGEAIEIVTAALSLVETRDRVPFNAVTNPKAYAAVFSADWKVGMLAYDNALKAFVPAVWPV